MDEVRLGVSDENGRCIILKGNEIIVSPKDWYYDFKLSLTINDMKKIRDWAIEQVGLGMIEPCETCENCVHFTAEEIKVDVGVGSMTVDMFYQCKLIGADYTEDQSKCQYFERVSE